MVKSVLGVYHAGFRDWFFQRLSAVVMFFYSLFFIFYFLCHPHVSYLAWRSLFTPLSMKVITLVVLLNLLYHSWVGMWTVLTDYVKVFPINLILNVAILLMLISCFFWGFMILWSV